jgi:hypothetical protein
LPVLPTDVGFRFWVLVIRVWEAPPVAMSVNLASPPEQKANDVDRCHMRERGERDERGGEREVRKRRGKRERRESDERERER